MEAQMNSGEAVDDDHDEPIWPEYEQRRATRARLLLVDDHPVVREGLGALLSLESDLEIVGDAGDIGEALELVRTLSPDLVICDLSMPGCSGGTAVRTLCREFPQLRVLVMTAHDALESIRECFNAGAIAYVRKDALRADLLVAVRRAAAGLRATCPGVGDILVRSWLRQGFGHTPNVEMELEPEDRQVLRMIALGVPTRRIADDLGRGVKAVEKYRANLLRRLDLHSTAAVARFAIRCNLLSPQEVDQVVTSGGLS
jgi:DNA-binding NarL/FixJ family response regulator